MQIESDTMTPGAGYSAPPAVTTPGEPGGENSERGFTEVLFGDDGFSFFDLLDIINPLHHIPVVSTFYRNWTGDEIGAAPRVAGGALFWGPIGAGVAAVNAVLQETTGNDMGGHAVASLENMGVFGDGDDHAPEAEFATASGPGLPNAGAQQEAVSAWAVAAIADFQEAGRQADLAAGGARTAVRSEPLGPVAALAPAPVGPRRPPLETTAKATAAADDGNGWASVAIAELREAGRLADHASPTTAKTAGREHADAGAAAPLGGWFSDVMLTAMASYRETDKLLAADAGRFLTMDN